MGELLLGATLFLLAFCILKALVALWAVCRTRAFLNREILPLHRENLPCMLLIMCALREQSTLEDTVRYFLSIIPNTEKIKILLVTTERERVESPAGTSPHEDTISVAARLASNHPAVRHLHFPDPQGVKADQMNYAVRAFGETLPEWNIDSTFFAFYDCDSRPEPSVFDVFFGEIQRAPECNVLQQSSVYFKNFSRLGGSSPFHRFLLRAHAVRQTRFSFAYEIPRIRRVYDYCAFGKGGALGSVTFAPCIAHGLFVRGSVCASVPFPSGYNVEDMFWGFLLSARKEPVRCMPSLDRAEIPMSVGAVFKQMARWFQGPFLTFKYAAWMRRHEPNIFEEYRARIRKLQWFGLYDACVWAITLPVLCYLTAASFMYGEVVAVPFLIWISLYQLAGILTMRRYVPSREMTVWNTSMTALFGVVALSLYSLAAHYAIVQILLRRSLYFKTERS